MKTTYDPGADAMYIRLKEGVYEEPEMHDSGLNFKLDAEGNILGTEVLAASVHIDTPRQIEFQLL